MILAVLNRDFLSALLQFPNQKLKWGIKGGVPPEVKHFVITRLLAPLQSTHRVQKRNPCKLADPDSTLRKESEGEPKDYACTVGEKGHYRIVCPDHQAGKQIRSLGEWNLLLRTSSSVPTA